MNRVDLAAPPSPFKGLVPFEDSPLDALLFFGREREIEVIAANLVANRLTVLYGPSGVGKTSLLRAGVAQRLRADPEALVVVFSSWAGDPVPDLLNAIGGSGSLADGLAQVARREGRHLYVVLDQLEEYFLYHEEEHGPGTLLDELPEALRRRGLRANFLVGVREDAVAQLDAFKSSTPNLFANTLRLERLDRRAGEAAIIGPVQEHNRLRPAEEHTEVESELVDEVLRGVAVGRVDLGLAGRGGLERDPDTARIEAPFLQLVLERLWEVETGRGSRKMRVETLRELGGAAQIVGDHLERAMSELSASEKDAAAAMYNHLVTPSGTKIAHRAGDLAGYAGVQRADAERVLARLVDERIVRAGEDGVAGPRYEIFHDVLADAVLAWRARHEADRKLTAERAAATRRQRRTLAFAVMAAAAVAVLAALSVYAFEQRSNARSEARHARAGELAALASSQLPVDPERSLRLALQAHALEPSSQIEDVLRTTLRDVRVEAVLPAGGPVANAEFSPDGKLVVTSGGGGEARLFRSDTGALIGQLVHGAPVAAASFSPDGSLIVTAGTDNIVRIWPRGGAALHELEHAGPVMSATFSLDGRLLATTSGDSTARIWEVATGRLRHTLRHPHAVESASFSGDGALLVTAVVDEVRDRVARVFDVRTGRLVSRLVQPEQERVTSARFAPAGDLVVTGSGRDSARVWNARTGKLLLKLEGHKSAVLDAAFSPSGDRIVTASADQGARVWDAHSGDLISTLSNHTNQVLRARFSSDGEFVVTASADRRATVFHADAGAVEAELVGHGDSVVDVGFSPDGTTVVSASADGTARLWKPLRLPSLVPLGSQPDAVSAVAFSPDGREILSVGEGGDIRVWREGVGSVRRIPAAGGTARLLSFSSDARLLATADAAGTVGVRELASGRVRRTLATGGPLTAVALSSDGELVLTAGADGVRLWRTVDGTLLRALPRHDAKVVAASISPGGRRIVTAGEDKTARIWNAESGALERELGGHLAGLTSVSFSPDGRLVATTSLDHDTRIWVVKTGQLRWVLRQAATVGGASFSADGRWLATASQSAGVWDMRSGRELVRLRPRDRLVTAVAFSGSGWRIAAGGLDGTVETYECRLCAGADELVALARARLARLGAADRPR